MTGRIISIVSFTLAVVALVRAITNNTVVIVLAGAATFLLTCFMYFAEARIRQSGSDLINHLIYLLTKSDSRFIILHKEISYEYLSIREMQFIKDYELLPLKDNLEEFDDRYCWSSSSKNIEIKPKYDGQTIKYIWEKDIWNYFTICFNARIHRHQPVNTGAIISNLVDNDGICKPFLSISIRDKTRCAKLVAKIPKELKPANAKYEIYELNDCDHIITSENLEYNEREGGYTKLINFPRKRYGYAIVWEWGARVPAAAAEAEMQL
jgi:hypothetical protein